MRNLVKTGLLGLALSFSGGLYAGPYVGAGGSLMSFDDGFDTVDPINGFLRVGYALNENFEIGGEFNITLLPDEISDVDFDVDTTFIYLQGNIVMQGGTKLYLMFGRTDLTVTASSGGISIEGDETGTGYGFGVQIPQGGNGYISIDYIRYFDEDEFEGFSGDFDAAAFNLGYIGYFD
ncbi:MAG: porin family protein [Gammaproteobacteria bacterium]|nr:porin family protein [Gammaproteobacteria bacterium]